VSRSLDISTLRALAILFTVLKEGFIIKNYMNDNDYLYMSGIWESGNEKPLVSYSGQTTNSTSFRILSKDINLDLNNFLMYNNKLYAIVGGQLKTIQYNGISDVIFNDDDYRIKFNVTALKQYNDYLYIGVSGGQYVDNDGKIITKPQYVDAITPSLNETSGPFLVITCPPANVSNGIINIACE
jgi:hypothetical protein